MKSISRSLPAFLILAVMTTIVAARPAQAQTLTTLYSFAGSPDGAHPSDGADLYRGAAGNLYGSTMAGGVSNNGAVFKVDPSGHETVLYSFCSKEDCEDGAAPISSVIRHAAGNLYGTTGGGGANQFGTIFELDSSGHETVLYSFTGGADGGSPAAGLVSDGSGNLYGTASEGGNLSCDNGAGCGAIFKLDMTGHETALYRFSGPDGSHPAASLILDDSGNFYGTTSLGGNLACGNGTGCGVVFELNAVGHESVLSKFCSRARCTDGEDPQAGVIRDAAGNLYGTTLGGGDHSCGFEGEGCGVVFKLDAAGNLTVLHAFTGPRDGRFPYAGLIRDAKGNLYGTAYGGGCSGSGVVFKLDTHNKDTVLHCFSGLGDGAGPVSGLVSDGDGNGYGAVSYQGDTNCDSPAGCGTVFKISPK